MCSPIRRDRSNGQSSEIRDGLPQQRLRAAQRVALIGAEANELVLFDRDKQFSSEQGWGPMLNLLFPRGLMLLDFDHHRVDRRALSIAFKPEPMRHYADALDPRDRAEVAQWGRADAVLSGDQAADARSCRRQLPRPAVGPGSRRRSTRPSSTWCRPRSAPVRKPLPFTAMRKGVKGREFLVDYFTRGDSRRRRAKGSGRTCSASSPPRPARTAAAAGRRGGRSHELPDDGGARHDHLVGDVASSGCSPNIPSGRRKLRQEVLSQSPAGRRAGTTARATYDDLPSSTCSRWRSRNRCG